MRGKLWIVGLRAAEVDGSSFVTQWFDDANCFGHGGGQYLSVSH